MYCFALCQYSVITNGRCVVIRVLLEQSVAMWLVKYLLRHRLKQKITAVSITACFVSRNWAALIQSHFFSLKFRIRFNIILFSPKFHEWSLPFRHSDRIFYVGLLLIFRVFCMSCPSLNPLCALNSVKLWRFLLCSFLQTFTSYVHIFTSATSSKNLIYACILQFLWNSEFRASFIISM